jgi:tight adherence protein B
MSPMLIAIAAFVGVTALVFGVAVSFRGKPHSRIEDRLDLLTGQNTPAAAKDALARQASILSEPLDDSPGFLENLLNRFGNISRLLEQADTQLTPARLGVISLVLAVGGVAGGVVARVHIAAVVPVALFMGFLPLLWALWRRKRRLLAFGVQLPDALDMLARALRSGQSLGAGMAMVASELGPPLGKEFGRVFEEQNLGIPWEDSLNALCDRVPNLDLKFFVTALILQRQTGGDLAEILDKIAHLIRERFQIWGQVQALTGEGRISGIVLMGLPIVLFLAVYKLNPEYVMVLFTEPMGKKMLAVAVFLQILGALWIRKIVNIKV